jgi:hypothetical protein
MGAGAAFSTMGDGTINRSSASNNTLPNIPSGGLGNAANPYALGQIGAAMDNLQSSTVQPSTTPPVTNTTSTAGTGLSSNPYAGSTNPYVQAAQATTLGNMAGAQAATAANRVNQYTPYANLQYTQTGTDAQGNPIWSATQNLNPMFQGTLNNIAQNAQQATQHPLGSGPQLQTNVGGTGTQGWDAATQLIMNRLQPQIAQQTESQKAALANQGIVPGTAAYDNAMRTFNQQQNDLLTSAQTQGAALQNQLFNQNLQAGQFGNTAQQQMYANQLTSQNAPLQQLGAFQSATTPGYVNPYSQAAVSGPDYLGAYTTSNAANIAAQNAANAKTANLQNGLFGLGSSAILGAGGIGNLGTSILNGATTLGGLLGLGSSFGNSGMSSGLVNGGVTGNIYDATGQNIINSGTYVPPAADWGTAFGGVTGMGG